MIRELLGRLKALNELDGALHALRGQLALYPKMLAALDSKEAEAVRKLEAAVKAHAAAQLARRKAEKDVAELRARIAKYSAQQEKVKTVKESEAITHEIDGLKAKIDEADTAGLEALSDEERFSGETAALTAALERIRAEIAAERERIARQTEEKKGRIERLAPEREAAFSSVPDELVEPYTLLQKRFPGAAVVPLKEEACSGCGMSLVKARVMEVRRLEKPIRCDVCSRFLYEPAQVD